MPRAGWVVRVWTLSLTPWLLVGLLSSAVLYLSPYFRGQPASAGEALLRQCAKTNPEIWRSSSTAERGCP